MPYVTSSLWKTFSLLFQHFLLFWSIFRSQLSCCFLTLFLCLFWIHLWHVLSLFVISYVLLYSCCFFGIFYYMSHCVTISSLATSLLIGQTDVILIPQFIHGRKKIKLTKCTSFGTQLEGGSQRCISWEPLHHCIQEDTTLILPLTT